MNETHGKVNPTEAFRSDATPRNGTFCQIPFLGSTEEISSCGSIMEISLSDRVSFSFARENGNSGFR